MLIHNITTQTIKENWKQVIKFVKLKRSNLNNWNYIIIKMGIIYLIQVRELEEVIKMVALREVY